MKIKFKNWEKFNPRKDIVKTRWFSFSNDFFIDSKMYALDNDERLFLIYLLCEASKSNKNGEFDFIREHYRVHSRLPDRVPDRALRKFQSLQIIEQVRVRGAYASVRETYATLHNTTEQDRTETILPDLAEAKPRQVFDFDALYKKYPRKEGKSRGLKICATQIKTDQDYQLLSGAIDSYSEYVRKNISETKFIKHFSSFMSSWRDWLDKETGGKSDSVKKTGLEKWLEEENKNAY